MLGQAVTVGKVDITSRDQIVAICVQGKSTQAIPILDLPMPDPPPEGAEWIDAYRRWCGELMEGVSRSARQPMASLTGLPTRLSISTSVSMVNLAVFLFTTSDTRGRETIRISAASACFR